MKFPEPLGFRFRLLTGWARQVAIAKFHHSKFSMGELSVPKIGSWTIRTIHIANSPEFNHLGVLMLKCSEPSSFEASNCH